MLAKSLLPVPRTTTAAVTTRSRASIPKIKKTNSQVPTPRQKIQSKMLQKWAEKQLLNLTRLVMTIPKMKVKKLRLKIQKWRICKALIAFLAQKRLSCARMPSSWTVFLLTWTITLIQRPKILQMLPSHHRGAPKEIM